MGIARANLVYPALTRRSHRRSAGVEDPPKQERTASSAASGERSCSVKGRATVKCGSIKGWKNVLKSSRLIQPPRKDSPRRSLEEWPQIAAGTRGTRESPPGPERWNARILPVSGTSRSNAGSHAGRHPLASRRRSSGIAHVLSSVVARRLNAARPPSGQPSLQPVSSIADPAARHFDRNP